MTEETKQVKPKRVLTEEQRKQRHRGSSRAYARRRYQADNEQRIAGGKKLCECGNCNELIPVVTSEGKPAKYKAHHTSVGVNNSNWKGERRLTKDGYIEEVFSPTHPYKNKRSCVVEHRLVMEQHIGRYLKPDEDVQHHINGIKTDNRLDNLRLVTKTEHQRIHHVIDMSNRVCYDCGNKKTFISKRGYHVWFRVVNQDGKFRCRTCYCREQYNKNQIQITNDVGGDLTL